MPRVRRSTLPLALALTLGGTLIAPAAASAAASCNRQGSATVAENRLARVYSTQAGDLVGCLRSTGKKVVLLKGTDDIYYNGEFSLVQLAGRYVGFYAEVTDTSCKAACPPDYDAVSETVRVADLRARTSRSIPAIAGELAINSSGMIAWTQAGTVGPELRLSRGGVENDTVASGDVDLVALTGRYLLWRSAGDNQWLDVTS